MGRLRRRYAALASVPTALALALAGCGETGPRGDHATGGGDSVPRASGDVTVFAAASLTGSFTELARLFEQTQPRTRVRLSFAASSSLARQVLRGAPADVFASANVTQMRRVTDAGEAATKPTVFARNTLMIAVPPGNPAGVHGLRAFTKPRLDIAVCAPQVPCGAAARRAFRTAGIDAKPDTFEENVKAVLTKVALGEVDAGLVYRTDVRAARDRVEGISFPAASEAVNTYEIVALERAPNPEAAADFVDFVRSERGRAVLAEAGFVLP